MKNKTLPTILLILLLCLGIYSSKAGSMAFTPPVNDNLCNALPLLIDGGCEENNLNTTLATAESNEPIFPCAVDNPAGVDTIVNNSVWYSFVAPAEPIYLQASSETPNNEDIWQLDVYTLDGDCADLSNLSYVDCELPFVPFVNSPIMLGTTFTEGETYYVRVSGGYSNFTLQQFSGIGCVSINTVTPPVNDDICDAIELAVDGSTQFFNNFGATSQDGEFGISPPPATEFGASNNTGWAPTTNFLDHSVWFTFTTPENVSQIVVNLLSSTTLPAGNFNTQVAIYQATDCGDITSLEYISGGDNSLPPPTGGSFLLNINTQISLFCSEPNTTYYVVVDGGSSFLFQPIYNQGNFAISVTNIESESLRAGSVIEAPDCTDGNNGTLLVLPAGGAGEYVFSWDDPNMVGANFPNILTAGDYTLTLTDRCGESIIETFNIPASKFGELTVDAGMDESVCEAEAITLNGGFTGGFPLPELRLYSNDFSNLKRHDPLNLENTEVLNEVGELTMRTMEFIGEDLYGVSNNNLYLIDTDNGEITLVDTLLVSGSSSLSYVPSLDELYLFANDFSTGQASIYTVDRNDASLSLVKTLNTTVNGAAIDNEQNIFMAVFPDELVVQTFEEEESTFVGALASGFVSFGGLEIDPTDDKLYTAGQTSTSTGAFWQQISEVSKTDASRMSVVRDFENSLLLYAFAFKGRTIPNFNINWMPEAGLDDINILNPTIDNLSASTTYDLSVSGSCGTVSDELQLDLIPSVETSVDISLFEGEVYEGITLSMDTTITLNLMTVEGCDSTVTVNISVLTDTNDILLDATAISIYPNPVKDILQVSINEAFDIKNIYIRDLYGRVIHQLTPGQQQEIFSLSTAELPDGQYVLEIRGKEKYAIKRFVKMK